MVELVLRAHVVDSDVISCLKVRSVSGDPALDVSSRDFGSANSKRPSVTDFGPQREYTHVVRNLKDGCQNESIYPP